MSLSKCRIYQVEAHFWDKTLSHFIFPNHKLHGTVLEPNLGPLGDRQALTNGLSPKSRTDGLFSLV